MCFLEFTLGEKFNCDIRNQDSECRLKKTDKHDLITTFRKNKKQPILVMIS